GQRIVQEKNQEQLIVLTITDVTEMRVKAIELALKEKNALKNEIIKQKTESEILEKAVRERTKELQEATESLKEKNEELVSKNKELQSFTHISGHDLQEPLRKIQTFASYIVEKENKNLSDTGKEYLHRMQVAAQRMQQLIEDLLSFSRLSAR